MSSRSTRLSSASPPDRAGAAGEIAAAFKAACADEIEAPKPGNVHVFAGGHRMTAGQFLRSAEAAAEPLSASGARIGERILGAVRATSSAVGTNTNLGIILLCAPLAAAAEEQPTNLRAKLGGLLDRLDIEDADLAFQAIVAASPGGLGTVARHDVRAKATVSLKEAMAEAAGRDRVARQYVSAFEDIFVTGRTAFARARGHASEREWAALAVYLAFLSAFPDSHVARKHGLDRAENVRRAAQDFHSRMQSPESRDALRRDLLAWDKELKENNINPGTSADLTVATLFVERLCAILPSARNSG
jgi:triphosphoribosyl-dephospho-CoA synthase